MVASPDAGRPALMSCDGTMFPSPSLTLSHAQLHQCAQYARIRMARDGAEWMFMMPLYVLGHYFGDDWVGKHLFAASFLKPPSGKTDRPKQQQVGQHGYQLSENLFNLQNVEGFDGIHSRLLKGEIEPCIGELEAARFLKLRGEQIRFVTPKGKLGEDYDLEILRETGAICCEVKIRLEAEELTEEWAYSRLGDAREQLPKSKPGLTFLRIVGVLTNDELQAKARIIDKAVRRLFGQTKRIIGVVLLTRGYQFSEDGMATWSL